MKQIEFPEKEMKHVIHLKYALRTFLSRNHQKQPISLLFYHQKMSSHIDLQVRTQQTKSLFYAL